MEPDVPPAVTAPEDSSKLPVAPFAVVPDDKVNDPESPLVVVCPEVTVIAPVFEVG